MTTDSLPTLYKRRNDGAVQMWQIEVAGPRYRTHSGIEMGEITTSEWTKAIAKNTDKSNATSPELQAELEAQAKWQQKLDTGYTENRVAIDDAAMFSPMLAHNWDNRKQKPSFPLWVQPKLDGIRCIASLEGLATRKGKPIYAAPHIQKALMNVWKFDPDLVLDGELYADHLSDNFNRICSLARKQSPTPAELKESAEHLQYHVFDVVRSGRLSDEATFHQRWATLQQLSQNCLDNHRVPLINHASIRIVETIEVNDLATMDTFLDKWLVAGYEGQMVRMDEPYVQKRTKYLLKRKLFQDTEFTILDIGEGVGNRSNMAGFMVFQTLAGNRFTASIKGTRTVFRWLLVNKAKVIGKKATVKFFNWTPGDKPVPRFPCVTKIDGL